ncbi:MAG: DEAD/DEAH box helicase family protein [Atopobiaceae bacterium]|jgi:superfamily II DNA or RNA helicase|nr:DEAD/DEAH box helicase family protein [Atopobiaceae bacterium]
MGAQDITGLVKSSSRVVPEIYAYTTPEIARHDGWTKIGYTEQDVGTRIAQQTHTADVVYELEWRGNAVYDDGSGDTFRDTDFHSYLRKLDYEDKPGTEWFEITPDDSHSRFYEYRGNRGVLETPEASEYTLRSEQGRAVEETADYARLHEEGEYLWNAKPRFGKTLAAYDLCKRLDAVKVLIVTNRPAIANSWYDDYVEFIGTESGYSFVSSVSALVDKPFVMTREEYLEHINRPGASKRIIEFVSLQDLKGSIRFGGTYDKLDEVAELEWDVLVVDEAHEGVDTYKTDVAFDHIKRKFTLHLSGTPFKAIANEKFDEDAIFNWSYADEQKAKRDWDDPELPNPYADLPQLNLFTYQMSDIVTDEVARGKEIDGETVEYAFDLNEFFATSANGHFEHNEDVDRFLDALTTQRKYPFSTPELRGELKHTLWMLNRVDSAKALARKLKNHPVFGEYEIVLAAGDGRIDDQDAMEQSFDKVRKAIADNDKTITLSVGQLTTGVTVPEWTAVLMLSNMKSPSLYMQAAFRAQNPCLFRRDGKYLRKENAYVFDFDPARTLTIFEEFANDLCSDTGAGKGDMDSRKEHIRTLLNFFPVIGEDDQGEMVELDAEKVLSIPRRIRSREVVRRGFMSDFLFQNISNVFHAPSEVLAIIGQLHPIKEPDKDLGINGGTATDLSINDDGEVEIPEEQVIGKAADLFGDKVYGDVSEDLEQDIEEIIKDHVDTDDDAELLDRLEEAFVSNVSVPLVEAAKSDYGEELRPAQKNRIERKVKADAGMTLNRQVGDYKIQKRLIEQSRSEALAQAATDEESESINKDHDERKVKAYQDLVTTLQSSRDELVRSAGEDIVREVETGKKERKKQDIETGVRDHLRGFSRTIPSFLMAYGNQDTSLASFDTVIPADVFQEVTSISVDQFRFLRDGGDFTSEETGEVEHFDGHLFDPVVFDDSVKEFIRLRTELANYFDDSKKEDIFDYVPPQKTNQIYTPKHVVKQMVDLFEEENPGCFDDPSHTFADLYMKSGLYITEVITRLYNSQKMQELYPDDAERLRHILEKQVYGIAPTEIIYQIATHFILGFDNEIGKGCKTNFVMADSTKLATEGKLAEFVDETFGNKLEG